MKRIGLFFGSFNPIHKGHIQIVSYCTEHHLFDAVWLIISPHNPFKDSRTLAPAAERLKMAQIAFKGQKGVVVSDVEFHLPQPTYTIDTLNFLNGRWPGYIFEIIMGFDNINALPKWKEGEVILKDYTIYVYPRGNENRVTPEILSAAKDIRLMETPLMPISSTQIREGLKGGAPFSSDWILPETLDYIQKHGLYLA